ncbi:MAG: hypothetical protein O2800_00530 [Planctomycetota bacterium]|nr:hypothetical protein [Planctomycetota bacterium]
MRTALALATYSSTLFLAAGALAQATSNVTVPAGQTCSVATTITITHNTFGTDSDSQTKAHALTGGGHLAFVQSAPPFTSLTANPFEIHLGPNNYTFSFFCFPFIGCQTLNVSITQITAIPAAPISSTISGTGAFSAPNTLWNLTADYSTSGIDTGTYMLIDTATASFSGQLTTTGQTLKLDQLSMGTVHFDVPALSLPAGISAIGLDIAINLSTNTMTGPWSVACASVDLNCDGSVNGVDLGIMLASWGLQGGDTNGDGTTDGSDLAMILSAWL